MIRTESFPRIAYTRHGERGAPVVLIMGFGMQGQVWSPQIEGLQDDHRLVTFDNRGIGASDDAPGAWRLRDLAEDTLRVMDEVELETAHVVGVSLGGMIAQEVALAAPERLRSLSLIATHPGGPTGLVPPVRGLRALFEASLPPKRGGFGTLAHLLYPDEYLANVDRTALRARMKQQFAVRPPKRVRRKQLAAVARHDTRTRLARLTVPTMIVRTGQDSLVSAANQARLVERMPAADVRLLERAGHGVIYQCREEVNRYLREHIAACEESTIGGILSSSRDCP